jgi:hypothetical protein
LNVSLVGLDFTVTKPGSLVPGGLRVLSSVSVLTRRGSFPPGSSQFGDRRLFLTLCGGYCVDRSASAMLFAYRAIVFVQAGLCQSGLPKNMGCECGYISRKIVDFEPLCFVNFDLAQMELFRNVSNDENIYGVIVIIIE